MHRQERTDERRVVWGGASVCFQDGRGNRLIVSGSKDIPGLTGRTAAILATDGVEEVEILKPGDVLREAGAFTVLVSPRRAEIRAMQADVHPARTYAVERPVADARAEAFDGLALTGGMTNPDQLRIDPASVAFVRHFFEAGSRSLRSAMGR